MAFFPAKKKCRQYSQSYLKFGFVPSFTNETMPMCLICEKTFTNDAMKPSKMKDHMERVHFDMLDKDLEYFEALKEQIRNRPNLKPFVQDNATVDNEGGLRASYKISLNIAKKGKSYPIGEEIILPAIKEVIETVMKKDSRPVLNCLALSASTVQRRIDDMADDVEKTLVSELQQCKFSIQLDESTFCTSNVLMAYVRYRSPSQHCIVDELLFVKNLEADAKGEAIFRCLEEYLEKHHIPLEHITAVAVDGASAMVGPYRDFVTLLKAKIPCVRTVHCVSHMQHLVAKQLSGELHEALNVCIRSINKLKAHPLNSRLSVMSYERNDESLNQLLSPEEIKGPLSDVNLQRLVDSYDTAVEFLQYVDPSLCDQLKRCKNHLFYLAELCTKFSDIQKRLQDKDVTIFQSRTILLGFQVKLGLFKSSLARRDFRYFPNLKQLEGREDGKISDADLEIFVKHLEKLSEDFKTRFEDLEEMKVPAWIITPFDLEIENADIEPDLRDELIDMYVDLEAKSLFNSKNLNDYWRNINTVTKYPKLCAAVEPFLLTFPSSLVVEAGFSHPDAVLTKQRNRLNLEKRGDLRLKLTNLQPNIDALVSAHQAHTSHYHGN